MSQVEVQIMGQGYLLASPDGGEQALLQAAARVDKAMCKIRDSGKIKARDRIAVLAALNLAYEMDSPPPEGASAFSPTAADTPEPQLDQLLTRLDAALGSDGQLI